MPKESNASVCLIKCGQRRLSDFSNADEVLSAGAAAIARLELPAQKTHTCRRKNSDQGVCVRFGRVLPYSARFQVA